MTTTDSSERSPAPGVIPGPTRIHLGEAPAAGRHSGPARSQNFVRAAFVRLAGALRGDRYMVGAYPADPALEIPDEGGSTTERVSDA